MKRAAAAEIGLDGGNGGFCWVRGHNASSDPKTSERPDEDSLSDDGNKGVH